jgi:ATP-dependent RNA helicase DBP3
MSKRKHEVEAANATPTKKPKTIVENVANGSKSIDEAEIKRLRKEAKKARKLAKLQAKAEKPERKEKKKAAKELKRKAAQEDSDSESSLIESATIDAEDGAEAEDSASKVEAQKFLTTNSIKITDSASPNGQVDMKKYQPILKFESLKKKAYHCLKDMVAKFPQPTPIQSSAWPFLFARRDVVGVAETGSGKTLAFGLPCVLRVKQSMEISPKGIKAVIVSPTRELALQSFEQLEQLGQKNGVSVVCVYGGVSKDDQRKALKKAQIVVATPGRLLDHMQEGGADLSGADYICLDEADRMLDKGFEADIKNIMSATLQDGSRQTVMFTATWPPSVRELAATFMKDYIQITIGDRSNGELQANVRISQKVVVMDPKFKLNRLIDILRSRKEDEKVLVFCLYKKEAARVEQDLRHRRFKVCGIHGDLSQVARQSALDSFKTGRATIMVATDVAARGLDIPFVMLVVNMTFPLTIEDYVHRIGRYVIHAAIDHN